MEHLKITSAEQEVILTHDLKRQAHSKDHILKSTLGEMKAMMKIHTPLNFKTKAHIQRKDFLN